VTRLCIGLLLLIAGCARPEQTERSPRFFWPIGSTEPRIEYLGFFEKDSDILKHRQGVLTTMLAGGIEATPLFLAPHDVASDSAGRLLVTDSLSRTVHLYNLEARTLAVLGRLDKDGSRKNFIFGFPAGVEFLPDGSIVAVDSEKGTLEQFSSDGLHEATHYEGFFRRPTSITYDRVAGRLLLVDTEGHAVYVIKPGETPQQLAGGRGSGEGQFNYPLDVEVDSRSNFYVVDALNARVQIFDFRGRYKSSFGSRGTKGGALNLPKAIGIDAQDQIYVTDARRHQVLVYGKDGEFLTVFGAYSSAKTQGGVVPGGFSQPNGIDVDRNSTIWICDSLNRMVHRFQYLTPRYLQENPVLPGDIRLPATEATSERGDGGTP